MGLLDRLRVRMGNMMLSFTNAMRQSGYRYMNDTLASNETIFSAISMLSGAMGTLPVTLRSDFRRVRPEEYPVARLLEYGPNPYLTTFQFIRCLETLRDCTGAGYAIKEVDAFGVPQALWLMKTEYVTPVINKDDNDLYYHIRDPDSQGDAYIHNSYILTVNHISTDGIHPINPIDVLRNSLNYDREVKEFSVDQMRNGLRANVVVKFKNAALNKDQLEEYDKLIRKFKRSGILYLDQFKDIQQLNGTTIIDPKVFEVENITIARVARVYTIPLEKFLPEKTSYSSAEQSDLNYLRDTILPMVRMYEQALTKWLLDDRERASGMYIKFALQGFARGDMETRGKFYAQGIRNGWFCQDEVRGLEDLPPIPGGLGQMFYISKDLVPIMNLYPSEEGGKTVWTYRP